MCEAKGAHVHATGKYPQPIMSLMRAVLWLATLQTCCHCRKSFEHGAKSTCQGTAPALLMSSFTLRPPRRPASEHTRLANPRTDS